MTKPPFNQPAAADTRSNSNEHVVKVHPNPIYSTGLPILIVLKELSDQSRTYGVGLSKNSNVIRKFSFLRLNVVNILAQHLQVS